jgi:hypothetical protein
MTVKSVVSVPESDEADAVAEVAVNALTPGIEDDISEAIVLT